MRILLSSIAELALSPALLSGINSLPDIRRSILSPECLHVAEPVADEASK